MSHREVAGSKVLAYSYLPVARRYTAVSLSALVARESYFEVSELLSIVEGL